MSAIERAAEIVRRVCWGGQGEPSPRDRRVVTELADAGLLVTDEQRRTLDSWKIEQEVLITYVRQSLEGLLGPDEIARLDAAVGHDLRNFHIEDRTGELIRLGQAVEAAPRWTGGCDIDDGYNACLDIILAEAERGGQ